ncbi:DNA-binding domain-containing protein [Poseidonocella sedimentorum]|uniref:Putative DNA-binding domain-containing protein n=1 Tax=Poseidonocella sedimentorum TaxID=871652 RepID=A0A1I6CVF0_9RHOB|nr:DNA-binding domain-containing protein [Poseidonocella sedimentorum]SFQ97209.1 Putative DNA-binding domain-containing protein [Poseidonocella sedimentorum]
MTRQAGFRAALLDARAPVPAGLQDGRGRPTEKRFAVYRNNVAVGLRAALETGFPVVRKLLGEAPFRDLAGQFLRASPPADPRMMHYGTGFPAYLEAHPALARLGYLGDVARLDLALRRSYHAGDAAPDAGALERIAPDDLPRARLRFAPGVICLLSRWPLFDLWRFNMVPGAAKPRAVAQAIVVLRPDFDPAPHLLPAGGGEVLAALLGGATLGEALARGPEGFDLAALLGLLISGHAITGAGLSEDPS